MKNVHDLKVAITHDTLCYLGGAERVVIALLKMFPHADVYTLSIKSQMKEILTPLMKGSLFSPRNYFTFINLELVKPFAAFYWESLDLSNYDLVISSSHSFSSKSIITQPATIHISYIHTTPRYLYTEFNESQWLKQTPWNIIFSPVLSWLRLHDFISAQRPDAVIVNSKTVKYRVKKYYRRNSHVVYPPANVKIYVSSVKKDYYLVVSRLVKQKGVDLAIKACNQLGKKLIVVGTGPELLKLQTLAGPSVTFADFINEADLSKYYSQAKALIYCSQDEDFGLSVVEALAHGTPVIGYRSGALIETIIPSKTGIMFDDYSTKSLCKTILKFEKMSFNQKLLVSFAKRFSQSLFKQKLTHIIRQQVQRKSI